jgi:aminopeptidase N
MARLAFDMTQGTISGTATLAIRATYHKLRSFSLDAYGLLVDQVTIDGAEASFAAREQKLVIHLPEPVDYGARFKVAIRYYAAPQPYRSRYVPYFDLGMVFQDSRASVLNEPDAAHSWFPCNDHPRDRATYDFTLRVPQPLDAVANGHLLDTTPHEDGTQTFHWQIAYPLATYLVALAVADYAAIDDQAPNGIPLRHYVYVDKVDAGREAFSATGAALVRLESLFGPYPYDMYGHVVVGRDGVALETETITTMPDSVLGAAGSDVAPVLVHELAHQWFGDTVSLDTWTDIWLNEGFATYAEWLDDEFGNSPDAALAARTVSEQQLIGGSRSTPLMAPAAAELFDTTSYEKGAWLLDLLRRQIGDEAFFKLLKAYAATFRDRPTDSLDFWQLAEEVSGQDLGPFFEQWLMQGDLPRYTLYWSGHDSGADVLLCAAQPEQYRLDLPLRFTSQTQTGDAALTVEGAQVRASFPLGFMPAEVIPDPDQTVLAQIQVQPIAALPESCAATKE